MRKNERISFTEFDKAENRYSLICKWLCFARWLERVCLFAALCLSVAPLLSGTRIAGIIPWLSLAAISTAFTADFIRGFLTSKADYYYGKIADTKPTQQQHSDY